MSWKQFLTENVLKECWHDVDTSVDVYFCKKCGMSRVKIFMGGNCATDHRTFDNRNDLIDLYEAIEKDGKWFSYEEKLFDNYKLGSYGGLYIPWLFCLDKDDYQDRCKMVAKFYGWEEKK